MTSLSYHAVSGNIALGHKTGQVELWQIITQAAPQVYLAHACVRERLAQAQAKIKNIEASLEKANNGLRQQVSREQELKRSIADLEAKCTNIVSLASNAYHVFSGEREEGT